jgi:hypothetical protein
LCFTQDSVGLTALGIILCILVGLGFLYTIKYAMRDCVSDNSQERKDDER